MNTTKLITSLALSAITSLSLVACGDDTGGIGDDDNCETADAPQCETPDDGTPNVVYTQIEHLGRPGIAEALLLSNGFLAGYNATAPTFSGVPTDALNMVVGEAKTVLKALFHGVCLLNGVAGINDPTMGLMPGGVQCAATGGSIFVSGGAAGTVLTDAQKAQADAYADAVFGLFEPDVMRIDTAITSGYFNLCGAGGMQGLCGGRLIHEDVIDLTFNFLMTGGVAGSQSDQVKRLISDGVQYSSVNTNNAGNLTLPDTTNSQQFRPAANLASSTFPYSGRPL